MSGSPRRSYSNVVQGSEERNESSISHVIGPKPNDSQPVEAQPPIVRASDVPGRDPELGSIDDSAVPLLTDLYNR